MSSGSIREGEQYQCDECCIAAPDVYVEEADEDSSEERGVCVWRPHDNLDEKRLCSYLADALMYGIEQDRVNINFFNV